MTVATQKDLLSGILKSLSKTELEKLVLKAASKDENFKTFLLLNYTDKEQVEQELFESALNDIDKLCRKNYKGFSQQLQMANMLTACNKRVNEFAKVCKNKKLEVDLLMEILKIPFVYAPKGSLGTCFSAYDYKVATILKKSISIINSKLHEDFRRDYGPAINSYLATLHSCSNHFDFVFNLPEKI